MKTKVSRKVAQIAMASMALFIGADFAHASMDWDTEDLLTPQSEKLLVKRLTQLCEDAGACTEDSGVKVHGAACQSTIERTGFPFFFVRYDTRCFAYISRSYGSTYDEDVGCVLYETTSSYDTDRLKDAIEEFNAGNGGLPTDEMMTNYRGCLNRIKGI